MYRAATVLISDARVSAADDVARVVCAATIDFDEAGQVRANGQVLANRIRTPAITAEIWRWLTIPAVARIWPRRSKPLWARGRWRLKAAMPPP